MLQRQGQGAMAPHRVAKDADPGGIDRKAGAARTGVGCDQDQAQFGGHALRPGLGHERFFVAGQPGQVAQRGPLAAVRRQEHGEAHRQANRLRRMRIEALHAAEANVFAE